MFVNALIDDVSENDYFELEPLMMESGIIHPSFTSIDARMLLESYAIEA